MVHTQFSRGARALLPPPRSMDSTLSSPPFLGRKNDGGRKKKRKEMSPFICWLDSPVIVFFVITNFIIVE